LCPRPSAQLERTVAALHEQHSRALQRETEVLLYTLTPPAERSLVRQTTHPVAEEGRAAVERRRVDRAGSPAPSIQSLPSSIGSFRYGSGHGEGGEVGSGAEDTRTWIQRSDMYRADATAVSRAGQRQEHEASDGTAVRAVRSQAASHVPEPLAPEDATALLDFDVPSSTHAAHDDALLSYAKDNQTVVLNRRILRSSVGASVRA
jgi:hypothetical protein